MRTVSLQSVLHGVANLLGMDPMRDLNPARAAHLMEYINNRAKEGWRFDFWPEWTVAEQRYYRDPYAAGQFIELHAERYHIGSAKYYQALQRQTLASQAPATYANGTWTENSAYWAELKAAYEAAVFDNSIAYAIGDQATNPIDALTYQRIGVGDISVNNAGTPDVNQLYTQSGTQNGKPYYIANGGNQAIAWDVTLNWIIYSFVLGAAYISNEDVATPDLVTTWNTVNGSLPIPSVRNDEPSNELFWTALTPFDRYVAYEQTDRTPIDGFRQVCRRSPKVNPRNPGRISGCWTSDNGIQVPATAPNIVFVEFRLRPPTFTSTPWKSGTAYDEDALVYFNGDTFRSAHGNNTDAVDGTVNWLLVPFPEVLATWVKRAVFSDALSDQKQQSRKLAELAAAQEELQDALDRELDSQGQYEAATVQTYGF